MQRKMLIVMMVLAALAAEGCRRRSERKQPPVSVDRESDFLFTRKKDLLGAGLEPIPKEKKIQVEDPGKEAREKAKRETDVRRLGKFLLDYRQKYLSPTLYSYERIRIDLRRAGELELYEEVTQKNIDIPYLVIDNVRPAQIIAYHKTVETEPDPTGKKTIEIGHATFLADSQFVNIKAADLSLALKKQELLVCWQYYVQFATPLFYRTAAEFGPYVANLQDQPPLFLSRIKVKNPDLLKNPPDDLNSDRFKKYLKENAPPQLLELVDKTLCVNMKPDMFKLGETVICRTATEGKDRGNLAIDAIAQITELPPDAAKAWIAANQAK